MVVLDIALDFLELETVERIFCDFARFKWSKYQTCDPSEASKTPFSLTKI